jgi:hypothetical protein
MLGCFDAPCKHSASTQPRAGAALYPGCIHSFLARQGQHSASTQPRAGDEIPHPGIPSVKIDQRSVTSLY